MLATRFEMRPDLTALIAELTHYPADLGSIGKSLELANECGTLSPLGQGGKSRDDMFGHTKWCLGRKTGRGKREEGGGEYGAHGIEQGANRGLPNAVPS